MSFDETLEVFQLNCLDLFLIYIGFLPENIGFLPDFFGFPPEFFGFLPEDILILIERYICDLRSFV